VLTESIRQKDLTIEEKEYKKVKETESQKQYSENIRNANTILIKKYQEDYERLT
jgi:hypothetical protein